MEIKLKYLIVIFLVISLSSCARMHIAQYSNIGISSEVKKEQIKAQKRINKQQRITDRAHRKRTKHINKLQNKELWK